MTIAAALITLLVPAGAARAQWSGVAAVVASQGYSASPGMEMTVPAAEAEAAAAPDDHIAAAVSSRMPAWGTAVADRAADRRHRHRTRLAHTIVHRRPAMVARIKRPLSRRHDRIAGA